MRQRALVCGFVTAFSAFSGWWTAARGQDDPPGPVGRFPQAYAITNARLFVAPGKVVDPGTIVVRRGLIEAVGSAKDVAVPYDAEPIEGKGLTVYPGFIDLYSTVGQRAGVDRSAAGRGRPVDLAEFPLVGMPHDHRRGLTPEFEVAPVLELTETLLEPRRRLGFTDMLSAPGGAIATGQSALVSLSGLPRGESILKTPMALHVRVAPPSEPPTGLGPPVLAAPPGGPRRRPNGDREVAENPYPRSLMGAVAHLRQAMMDARRHQQLLDHPPSSPALAAPYDPGLKTLALARDKKLPVWWEAETRDEIHRALDLAAEFGTTVVIVGGREASKVVDRLKAEGVAVILRLNFDDKEPKVPTKNEYQKRPLTEQDEPLRLLEHRRELWNERVAVAATLARAGVPFAFSSDGVDELSSLPARLRLVRQAGLSEDKALDALTRQAASIAGVQGRLGTLDPGKLGHLIAFTAPFLEQRSKVKLALIDGVKFEIQPGDSSAEQSRSGPRQDAGPRAEARAGSTASGSAERGEGGSPPPRKPGTENASKEQKPDKERKPQPPWTDVATEFDADRVPTIKTGGDAFIKDVKILTVARGTIEKGSIQVENGKIKALGSDLKPGPGTTIIEAAGLVAMPGIIDSHAHIAIQGGVNEMSLSVVPEVRVKDVVTGADESIYRALAGGTTIARLLHGSANSIGGQDAVIKLKHGRPGRELIIRDAPQGVKFALGENVTRSTGRFPNTRMGVEAVMIRAFSEAKQYRAAWKAYEDALGKDPTKAGPPPFKDLRLEALAGILEGTIKIHSHCYRSDEILMLLRTAEKFGVRIQSLQHVLEGYKVAAEIADHGASTSTFSDWWAYKIEAFDAIPFNAALMARAGVSVSIKSDSSELMRHLNLEAAKMVKYGGVTEEQALAMITINPARQLGLDRRLGSIEPGKDADIALFRGHPLDAFSRCELVLIDGEVCFQRPEPDGKLGAKGSASLNMPAPAPAARDRRIEFVAQPKGIYALVGATLHPVSSPAVTGGTLVVADGKIAAIGPAGMAVPPEAQTIDVAGLDIWPGMIALGTTLGLAEIGSLRETQDFADSGLFQPELMASTALRPDSAHLPVTRSNGILAAMVQPSGGAISGQSCLINLNGWVPREMAVQDPCALHVTIPTYVPRSTSDQRRGRAPGQTQGSPRERDPQARRKERLEAIRTQFRRGLRYDEAVRQARSRGLAGPPVDPRLAAFSPYVRGEKHVIFRADHRNEILDALAIAKEFKLKAVVAGALEGWKVAQALKESGVPVIVGATLNEPGQEHDPYDAAYANPARMHAAGVTLAIASTVAGTGAASGARNLPYEAATAVAFGLPEDEALKAVTLNPARILGLGDQLGSLEPGKRANLVVTAGHLLQPTTQVLALFIDGKPVSTENKQTELYDLYSRRLQEVRAGRAPLGLDRPAPAPRQATDRGTTAPREAQPVKRKAG